MHVPHRVATCRLRAAAWLAGIIVNLLLARGFYDIALRDLGLFLGALALGRLSAAFDPASGTPPAR